VLVVLTLSSALLTVDVLRLVVDHHKIAPAAEQPPDRRVCVLTSATLHRAQNRLGDEPTFLKRHIAFTNPIIPPAFERNALPVTHQHIRVELFAIFRRHYLEFV